MFASCVRACVLCCVSSEFNTMASTSTAVSTAKTKVGYIYIKEIGEFLFVCLKSGACVCVCAFWFVTNSQCKYCV